ncbi:hypothetical protein ACHAXN_003596 [Cyclotella atomus]|jgi:hypothetical protein
MKSITVALSLLLATLASSEFTTLNSAHPEEAGAAIDIVPDEPSSNGLRQNSRSLQSGPNAEKRKINWRKVHNAARKKYQVQYGGTFTPIKWSDELHSEALLWAKELVSNCVNRLPGSAKNPNNYGVNAAMNSKSRIFRSPFAVMNTWENKLQYGYPANSVMTQVLWSKTKYVGCADAASSGDAEKCSASVCYYAKAGNCAFGRFNGNWTQAVVSGPACSTNCPSDVVDEEYC